MHVKDTAVRKLKSAYVLSKKCFLTLTNTAVLLVCFHS